MRPKQHLSRGEAEAEPTIRTRAVYSHSRTASQPVLDTPSSVASPASRSAMGCAPKNMARKNALPCASTTRTHG